MINVQFLGKNLVGQTLLIIGSLLLDLLLLLSTTLEPVIPVHTGIANYYPAW